MPYFIAQQEGSRPGHECRNLSLSRQLLPAWAHTRGKAFVLGSGTRLWVGAGARPLSAALGLTPWQLVRFVQERHSLRE